MVSPSEDVKKISFLDTAYRNMVWQSRKQVLRAYCPKIYTGDISEKYFDHTL